MSQNERLIDLPYPMHGVHVNREFDRQPKQTSVDAQNMRTMDAIALRDRGGCRQGLTRFIDQQLGPTIQHLGVLVDPTIPGLLTTQDTFGGTPTSPGPSVPDPSTNNKQTTTGNPNDGRNPGRNVRNGGSGVQPNRHTASGSAIASRTVKRTYVYNPVASTELGGGFSIGPYTFPLSSPITASVQCGPNGPFITYTVDLDVPTFGEINSLYRSAFPNTSFGYDPYISSVDS